MHRISLTLLASLVLACAMTTATVIAQGKTYLTVKQALALAFPKCEIKRQTIILDKTQCEQIGKLSGRPFKQRFINPYIATKKGKLVGTAYFDNHKVRTLKQTLMIVVTPDHKIARIELLRFGEPPEYAARKNWLAQFDKKKLSKELNLKRQIRGMTGASLTARATTKCARRILALHQALNTPVKTATKPTTKPAIKPTTSTANPKQATSRPTSKTSKT